MLNLYAIYDKKACSYNTPFYCKTNGIAVRIFADLVSDTSSVVSRHPEDFELYCLGEFNEDTGETTSTKIFQTSAVSLIPQVPESDD